MFAPYTSFCDQLECAQRALNEAADEAREPMLNAPNSEYAKTLHARWIRAEEVVEELLEQIQR